MGPPLSACDLWRSAAARRPSGKVIRQWQAWERGRLRGLYYLCGGKSGSMGLLQGQSSGSLARLAALFETWQIGFTQRTILATRACNFSDCRDSKRCNIDTSSSHNSWDARRTACAGFEVARRYRTAGPCRMHPDHRSRIETHTDHLHETSVLAPRRLLCDGNFIG